jgi:hypothetical protein
MKKRLLATMIIIFISFCFTVPSFAGWLISHKQEYCGKIIDAETKEPIEGVVVVALYYVHAIIGGPGGPDRRFIHAKEALTDENGEFVIPSYTTLMSPNAFDLDPDFVIYKAGYASFPEFRNQIFPFQYCGPAYSFLGENVGKNKEYKKDSETVTVTFGVAELPKLNTKEERIRATHSMNEEEDQTPLLLNAVNEELKRFGLGIVGPFGR